MVQAVLKSCVLLAFMLAADARITGRRLRNGEPCDTPGYFGDAEDCRKFYRCAEHPTEDENNPLLIKYTFRCPSGTAFDESLSTCNHPDAVMNKPANCQIYDPEDQSGNENGDSTSNSGSSSGQILLKHQPILIGQPQVQLVSTVNQNWPWPYATLPLTYGNVVHFG